MSEKNHTGSKPLFSPSKPAKAKSPPVKAEPVEAPKPTQEIQKGMTPQEEALYRLQEGVPPPNSADFEAAKNPAAAQNLATAALLMGDQPPAPEELETAEEFRARYVENTMPLEGFQGITREDMQQRQNLEVAMISSENPVRELQEQRLEGYSHLPQPVVPESRRSLSLEELGRRKVELGNPGAVPFMVPRETDNGAKAEKRA